MPKSSPSDPPNLWKQSGSSKWYARVRVPPGAGLKSSHIKRSLKTASKAEAIRRLSAAVAAIRTEIEAARRDSEGRVKGRRETDLEAALYWRERIKAAGADPAKGVPLEMDAEFSAEVDKRLGEVIGETEEPDGTVEPVYAPDRERKALAFVAMVGGRLPVAAELDRFFDEQQPASSYRSRIKLAVTRLGEWLADRPAGDVVQAVSRSTAARYVDHLANTMATAATVNSHVSALSTYWDWMDRRNDLGPNPWKQQQRPARSTDLSADKRAFTDDEVVALLGGKTSRTLHDSMRLALLTGMRLSEIARLQVRDVTADVISVADSKTRAGVRKVPLHPDLAALVARRCANKEPDGFLLEELKAPKGRPERRGQKVGERFTTYRRDLGLDEREEGRRQANADFHSFRRWHITKLEQAGVAPHLIAALVGHEEGRDFLALVRYSAGPSRDQLVEAIGKVELPTGALVESPVGRLMGRTARASRTRRRT